MKIIKEGKVESFLYSIRTICPRCGAEFEFDWNDCYRSSDNSFRCDCPTPNCQQTFEINIDPYDDEWNLPYTIRVHKRSK